MLDININSLEDRLLWEKFLAGDDAAFSVFYEKYVAELFAYGMRFTSDRELVKDCIQDVFVKIYNHRSNLNPKDHVKFYLFLALKNTLLNVFCKHKNLVYIDTVEPVFMLDYIIDDNSPADEEDDRRETMKHILESLTPRQKEVIYYRYVEGMELDEIGTLMDMNYQSVLNLIQRSIQRVKKIFGNKNFHTLKVKHIS